MQHWFNEAIKVQLPEKIYCKMYQYSCTIIVTRYIAVDSWLSLPYTVHVLMEESKPIKKESLYKKCVTLSVCIFKVIHKVLHVKTTNDRIYKW